MLKGVIRVTRYACDHRMQSKERKGSQAVVERDSARKRIFIVTFRTVAAQTLEMYVVATMAADAAVIHLFRLRSPRLPGTGVTRRTRSIAMRSAECEIGALSMVETDFGPFPGMMAVSAIGAESTRMDIFARMTSGTILR